jgi:hypothetical protein
MSPLDYTLHPPTGSEWRAWEVSVAEAGRHLPFAYRFVWAEADPTPTRLLRLNGASALSACAVQARGVGLGHHILRVDYLGPTVPAGTESGMASALVHLLRRDHRALRLDVRIFHPDDRSRSRLADALRQAGLVPSDGGSYTRTLVVDCGRPISDVLAGFSASARRNIRSLEKMNAELHTIVDDRWVNRINDLMRGTMERTGAGYAPRDWTTRIHFARGNPGLARLAGVFLKDQDGDAALAGVAWSRLHGDHGEYNDAASARSDGLRLSPGYPLLWDAISWAHERGARWFDLGGITPGGAGTDGDPLGGISDFKRRFSDRAITVAEEWTLDASTAKARVARTVHGAVKRFRDRRSAVGVQDLAEGRVRVDGAEVGVDVEGRGVGVAFGEGFPDQAGGVGGVA